MVNGGAAVRALTVTQAPGCDNWQIDVQALRDQAQQQAAIDRVLGRQLVYDIFQLGDLAGAERFLLHLLRAHPNDIEILENLAVMHGRQGKAPEAVACFEQVVARASGAANAWDGLACWGAITRSSSGTRRSSASPSCWATQPATTRVRWGLLRLRWAWRPR